MGNLKLLWKHKPLLFWIPIGLILINGLISLTYRGVFLQKIQGEWNQKKKLEEEVHRLERHFQRLRTVQKAIEENKKNIETFEGMVQTKKERLTPFLSHLDELTRRVQLVPHALSFAEEEERDAVYRTFTVNFPVEGSYQNIRELLHLLEVSEHFIVVDRLALSQTGELGEKVRLNILLYTLFKEEKS